MNLIKPGVYTAKVIDYGVPDLKPGKHPQVMMQFEFDYEGAKQRIRYFGSLHPNASDYTIKSLLNAGFRFDSLEPLTGPNAFDGRECQIVVEHHEYEGKVSARVKWVNGASSFKSMDPADAKAVLSKYTDQVKIARFESGQAAPSFAQPKNDFDIGA